MRMKVRVAGLLMLAVGVSSMIGALRAAEWPSRPIVVLDGFAPGGGTDVLMRVMAVEMTKTFGQPVVVENRSGASGHIAAEAVARAVPDGQMIMIHTASMITSRPLYAKLGYDVLRDLTPVTQIVSIPNVLVVPPALPVRNVREFLLLAKRRPGELIFGSTGLDLTCRWRVVSTGGGHPQRSRPLSGRRARNDRFDIGRGNLRLHRSAGHPVACRGGKIARACSVDDPPLAGFSRRANA